MRVCIYGTQADSRMLLSGQSKKKYDFIIVMKDNADGMEGVIAVKALFSEMPIIWFSNDRNFGAQSYRLNISYFHEKPVTAPLLSQTLSCCNSL